jgi:hypothetical protein
MSSCSAHDCPHDAGGLLHRRLTPEDWGYAAQIRRVDSEILVAVRKQSSSGSRARCARSRSPSHVCRAGS